MRCLNCQAESYDYLYHPDEPRLISCSYCCQLYQLPPGYIIDPSRGQDLFAISTPVVSFDHPPFPKPEIDEIGGVQFRSFKELPLVRSILPGSVSIGAPASVGPIPPASFTGEAVVHTPKTHPRDPSVASKNGGATAVDYKPSQNRSHRVPGLKRTVVDGILDASVPIKKVTPGYVLKAGECLVQTAYQCPDCRSIYPHKTQWAKHLHDRFLNDPPSCPIQTRHGRRVRGEEWVNMYVCYTVLNGWGESGVGCPQCPRTFENMHALQVHQFIKKH